MRGWPGVALLGISMFFGCAKPEPVLDLYLDAVALRELDQNELAVEKLSAVVQADPNFALAYSELGKAHQALGDPEEAAAAFGKAVKLDPWSVDDCLGLARASEALDRYPQAAEAYGRVAELDPNNLEALIGAAKCNLKAGDYVRTLTYCESAEQAGAEPRRVLLLRARVYEGQKNYAQAVQVYHRLLAMDPQDADTALALGKTYMKAEQYDRAREVLTSLAQMRPEDGKVYRHLGYCFAKLRDADQAIGMYKRSIDLDGRDWEAHRGLGVAYMIKARQSGDARWQPMAVEHWRRSLAIKPDQPRRETLEKLIREHGKLENPLQGLKY